MTDLNAALLKAKHQWRELAMRRANENANANHRRAIHVEDLGEMLDAFSDIAASELAALPEPSGPVVERVARAMEPNMPVQIRYWREGGRHHAKPLRPGDPDFVSPTPAAQAALSVMLAEIEAEPVSTEGYPPTPHQKSVAEGMFEMKRRLTARLTGGQGDD